MTEITEINVADHPEFDAHETIVRLRDSSSRLHALIGIHSTVLGPSLGGCRIKPYASEAEALTDVLRLSRGMTYKSAVVGLPLGGGKAVILADPKTMKTDSLMESFGAGIEALSGRYITAEDVGSNENDMIRIARRTRYVTGLPVANAADAGGNPSPVTAYGVYCGIKSSVGPVLGRSDLKGLRVAVQGLGAVGFALCEYLYKDGAELVVTDVDAGAIARAQQAFAGKVSVVPTDVIHTQNVDVFAPCALGAGLNDATIPALKCKLVAGAANNQLAEKRHDKVLADRGIVYAPDYVINSGGVTAVGYEYFRKAGHNPYLHPLTTDYLQQHVERIGARLPEIYERAQQAGTGTGAAADALARDILTKAKHAGA